MFLRYGERVRAGVGYSTALALIDWETYSEAGYRRTAEGRWVGEVKGKPGIKGVGTVRYAEHPSTDITALCYDLRDGKGRRVWAPGMAPPLDLFRHVQSGRLVEAFNWLFDFMIWEKVAVERYGFPSLRYDQMICTAAKARQATLPRDLDGGARVLRVAAQKDTDGAKIMKSPGIATPRSPSKKNPIERYHPADRPEDFAKLWNYAKNDIATTAEVSRRCADLSPTEMAIWRMDQRCNLRGVGLDRNATADCVAILEQARARYTDELRHITNGAVPTTDSDEKMKQWLAAVGVMTPSIDETHVKALLEVEIPAPARRVLELRLKLRAASVKKVYALWRRCSPDGRVRDLFLFDGTRTRRWAGLGPQPQNMKQGGPDVSTCSKCDMPQLATLPACRFCHNGEPRIPGKWNARAARIGLDDIATRSLDFVETMWGDALELIAGCLRALFIASPGHELIWSDFSSMEAVILAMVSGEQWRMDVFNDHGRIYEVTAATLTGIPFDPDVEHPYRRLGKIAELASGYKGWVGAWKRFGADKFLSDDEIETHVKSWREANPMIRAFWAAMDSHVRSAVENPGEWFRYREIGFHRHEDTRYLQMPSGDVMPYLEPRLDWKRDKFGRNGLAFSYSGITNEKGSGGWGRLDGWAGRTTENIVQRLQRDWHGEAMVRLEGRGYLPVLHIHDEPICEVPVGFGSIEELEAEMMVRPWWAPDWPIRAKGGKRSARYG